MNTKIVNQLIFLNNEYEKQFQQFVYKTDVVKIVEFEHQYYVETLANTIIPTIYIQLRDNSQDKIDFYLPYIKTKYHNTVIENLKIIKTNDEKRLYDVGKKISQNFNADIILYRNFKDEDKNKFLKEFYEKNEENLKEILQQDPQFFIKIVSQLRSPKMQYHIINKSFATIEKYLTTVEKSEFEQLLKDNVFYPMDIEIEDYYKKWIGKDKIHVKFLKSSLGHRYHYAKMFSKMSSYGKKPKLIVLK